MLSFNEYQDLAKETAIYPQTHKIVYPTLGLCGEAGEFAEKIKKSIRDNIDITQDAHKALLMKELGDVLWYLSAICTDLDVSLEDVAVMNYQKLKSRKDRDVLHGNGDNR